MLTRRHFRLQTFGRLSLASVAGDSVTVEDVRPRHLAVLAVLAFSRRPVLREKLLEMFWGGETPERARHSLSNALSGLRGVLGPDAITARQDEVGLAEGLPIELDAVQFASAWEVHDDERAAKLYAGPFLDGVYVPDAEEFDRWVGRERTRFEREFLEVCERRAPLLLRAGNWSEAADLARRWLDAAPDSVAAFTTLLRAQAGPGTPAALRSALDEYARTRTQLAQSRGVKPAPAVQALAAELRDRLTAAEQELSETMRVPVAAALAPVAAVPPAILQGPARTVSLSPRAWRYVGAGAAIAALLLIGVLAVRRRSAAIPDTGRPVIAVTAIDDVRGDSSIAWLRAGLPRMIASGLSANGDLEVVAPSRVRDVVVRLTGSSLARLTEDQSVDVARRLNATWVVTGGVSTANGGYLLDVTARNVESPRDFESFTVFAATPIELGSLAASRLETLLGERPDATGSSQTVRFSGIETSNADAYRHFIRAALAEEADQIADAARESDAAIALDSGFVVAIRQRLGLAGLLEDTASVRKLSVLEKRNESRLSAFDRLVDEINSLDTLGETARAEALSAVLVKRYPRDPIAQSIRADRLSGHGRWAAAESALVNELALDSLAISAGPGPCTPCEVFRRLSLVRLQEGNATGAEAAAREWVGLQPDLTGAWRNLTATLAAVGRSAEAVDAGYHVLALTRDAPWVVDFGRTMLSARRYDIVDSLLKAWRDTRDPVLAEGALDLRTMLQRERGQFAASIQTVGTRSATSGMMLVKADGLARLGRMAEARQIFERSGHPVPVAGGAQLTSSQARAFAWAHALEADDVIRAGDTSVARPFIDSITRAGAQSYYGRDKHLQHHVRGLLLFAERKFPEAEREFKAAEWSACGWTRTNVELARAQLAQGHVAAAVATLRDADLAPLDAMGRYVPQSELDWWMARAFAQGGQRDSAAKYAGYVRSAWAHADPVLRVKLDSLPR